jgi:hypothetical protein
VSLADEGDARLRKRIAELEAENRSLHKIIVGIQSALKSVPDSAILASANANGLRIASDQNTERVASGEIGITCASMEGAVFSRQSTASAGFSQPE